MGLKEWERRNEYYKTIELGEKVELQTKAINKQTKAFVEANIEAANMMIAEQLRSSDLVVESNDRIVSSLYRVDNKLDSINYSLESISEGMFGLKAAFEWGISEVVWQIEQNREVLISILQVLQAPLETQGKELRRRAEEAYENGWIDDALEDFLESEKRNRYDFSIHISLGLIYLLKKDNKENALESFEKAIKYAKPKSSYHTSYALLYKALIKNDMGYLDEAEKCTAEAADISPTFAEALYENARYNSLLNNAVKAINTLEKAIKLDVNYCEKIIIEKDFDNVRDATLKLFLKLRDEQGNKVMQQKQKLFEVYTRFVDKAQDISLNYAIANNTGEINDIFNSCNLLIDNNSYRDYLEAEAVLDKLMQQISAYFSSTRAETKAKLDSMAQALSNYNHQIQYKESEAKDKIKQIESSNDYKEKNSKEKFSGVFVPLAGIFSVFMGLRGCWIAGPGGGNPNPFAAFGELFTQTLYTAAICLLVYIVITTAISLSNKSGEERDNLLNEVSNGKRDLSNRIADTKSEMEKLKILHEELCQITI